MNGPARLTAWAKGKDAPRLAFDMGHVSPHMIFGNYREIVKRRTNGPGVKMASGAT